VPGQPLPEPFVYMNYDEARSKRASSEGSEDLKPWEVREKEKGKLVPTPQVVYDQISESKYKYRMRRSLSQGGECSVSSLLSSSFSWRFLSVEELVVVLEVR
jgi:hypothetical protein